MSKIHVIIDGKTRESTPIQPSLGDLAAGLSIVLVLVIIMTLGFAFEPTHEVAPKTYDSAYKYEQFLNQESKR